jgi:chromosome segregation ATPase
MEVYTHSNKQLLCFYKVVTSRKIYKPKTYVNFMANKSLNRGLVAISLAMPLIAGCGSKPKAPFEMPADSLEKISYENQAMSRELANLRADYTKQSSKYAELERDYREAKEFIDGLKETLSNMRAERRSLSTQNQELDDKIRTLEKQLKAALIKIQDYVPNEKLSQECERLRTRLEEERAYASGQERMRAKAQAILESAVSQYQSLKTKSERLERENAEMKRRFNEWNQKRNQ